MIDASEIVTNLVAMLRDVPDLVGEMGGDAERIYAYHDQYPKNVSLVHAMHAMPAPSIMAVWQGTQPGSFGGVDVWKHQVTLFLRAKETAGGDPPTAYYRLFRLLTKGIPTAAGDEMINATVHTSCYRRDGHRVRGGPGSKFLAGEWPDDPSFRFLVHWALRREELCDPSLCPDAPEEDDQRCDHCPLDRLDAAQCAEKGLLIRRALDMMGALKLGVHIGLEEIRADEFSAMLIIAEERDLLERERLPGQHAR